MIVAKILFQHTISFFEFNESSLHQHCAWVSHITFVWKDTVQRRDACVVRAQVQFEGCRFGYDVVLVFVPILNFCVWFTMGFEVSAAGVCVIHAPSDKDHRSHFRVSMEQQMSEFVKVKHQNVV